MSGISSSLFRENLLIWKMTRIGTKLLYLVRIGKMKNNTFQFQFSVLKIN
jgi:hypothetical protein